MTQLGLPLSRRTDPASSHAAAGRVPEFRASHEGVIYGSLLKSGKHELLSQNHDEQKFFHAGLITRIEIAS